jgi:hypothetical protein
MSRDKIAALRRGIVDAIERQVHTQALGGKEGTAIVTSALVEVTLNFMLMHYGAEYTDRAVKRALEEFLKKARPN